MKVIIIGSGIAGLSAAYFLSHQGHDVDVCEREKEVGGLAGFFQVNGTYLERYYHHSFAGHTGLIELMEALNIRHDYFFRSAETGFYYDGTIYPFVSAKDLLFFEPLRLMNRVRLGLASFLMMRIKDWRAIEKISAIEWLKKYSGREVCRIIWEPLLKMKFGDDYAKISAAWLLNRVVDRKSSGTGKDVLGYISGGYKTLFDALIRDIKAQGGAIRLDSRVEKIDAAGGVCIGVTINKKHHPADVVISTLPVPAFLEIAPGLPQNYLNDLKNIKYQGSVCMVLKLKRPLSKYYWINVSDPESPFVGIIEHTNFIPPEHYGNAHLVYLTRYASPGSDIFLADDRAIFKEFTGHLGKIFKNFSKNNIENHWVFRDRYSQPVFVKNYSQILPDFETPVKGLYLLNTAQIYPQSRSLNSGISKARDLATEILDRER